MSSNDDRFAPTFDIARNTLAALLDGVVFGCVTRDPTRPDRDKPYFHGTITAADKTRVWFQQTNGARRPMTIGPLTHEPPTFQHPPRAGDVLMGKVDVSAQGERHKARLTSWYSDAKPMRALAKVCTVGTVKHEMQLLGDMRGSCNDDVWALCRLVLFGNVKAFADMHVRNRKTMRLSRSALEFVHAAAETLGDDSIWDEFVRHVPDALPPAPTPPHSPYRVSHIAVGFEQMAKYDPSVPYTPASPPYTPASPPYTPASPPYNPVSPPASPSLAAKVADASQLLKLLTQFSPPAVEEYDPMRPAYSGVEEYDPMRPAYTTDA